jgi:hypothetical protein
VRDLYVPKYAALKYFLLALSTNAPDPIRIERGDRRYFICNFIEHSKSSEDSAEFFQKFATWLEQQDGYQIMCNWLHSLDISDANFRTPPITQAKLDLMEQETSAEGNTQLASLEIATTYRENAFMLKSVQDTWKLSQKSAVTALKNAGFEGVKRRWITGQKPTTLWIQKAFIPKINEPLKLDVFTDKRSFSVTLRSESNKDEHGFVDAEE